MSKSRNRRPQQGVHTTSVLQLSKPGQVELFPCACCGEKKPREEMQKQTHRRLWVGSYCKKCAAVKAKAYREAHKEQIKEYYKEWVEKNIEKKREYNRQARQKAKERHNSPASK